MLAATALMGSLAWEPPYPEGEALEKAKRQKKKKERERERENTSLTKSQWCLKVENWERVLGSGLAMLRQVLQGRSRGRWVRSGSL